MLEGGGEGNLLMDGAASNTQKVAGAVIGVGQVGRGGVRRGTVNCLLTLARHQAEAVTECLLTSPAITIS